MPRKSRSRKKKGGAGMFDFLKAGESKSYTKKRCKEYERKETSRADRRRQCALWKYKGNAR